MISNVKTFILFYLNFLKVDHFSFSLNEKFNIRYLVNDSYWNEDKGPIFFYTGNEGDIEVFAQNTVRKKFLFFVTINQALI